MRKFYCLHFGITQTGISRQGRELGVQKCTELLSVDGSRKRDRRKSVAIKAKG